MLARNLHVSNLAPSGHHNPDYAVLLILVCMISYKFSYLSHLFVSSFTLTSYISYTLDLNLITTPVNGHFWRCMLKHTKRQVRYYKSQLYNAFVISDVCKHSLSVDHDILLHPGSAVIKKVISFKLVFQFLTVWAETLHDNRTLCSQQS